MSTLSYVCLFFLTVQDSTPQSGADKEQDFPPQLTQMWTIPYRYSQRFAFNLTLDLVKLAINIDYHRDHLLSLYKIFSILYFLFIINHNMYTL